MHSVYSSIQFILLKNMSLYSNNICKGATNMARVLQIWSTNMLPQVWPSCCHTHLYLLILPIVWRARGLRINTMLFSVFCIYTQAIRINDVKEHLTDNSSLQISRREEKNDSEQQAYSITKCTLHIYPVKCSLVLMIYNASSYSVL